MQARLDRRYKLENRKCPGVPPVAVTLESNHCRGTAADGRRLCVYIFDAQIFRFDLDSGVLACSSHVRMHVMHGSGTPRRSTLEPRSSIGQSRISSRGPNKGEEKEEKKLKHTRFSYATGYLTQSYLPTSVKYRFTLHSH